MSTNDLIVVLPGIMGSVLTKNGDPVWAPQAGALVRAIRMFGNRVNDLTLPDGLGDDHPGDGVEATDLLPTLHAIPGLWAPIKGYDLLLRRLRDLGYREPTADQPGNLLPFPYDWRLSNRYNARRLKTIVEPALERWRARGGRYADAQIVFVCHSMGGLVARWYIEREDGAEFTRKLITFGTPYRGAAKALVQLVNGISPALGRIGPDLTRLSRSFPSTYQLLPEYACITSGADLVHTTDVNLPDLPTAMVTDARTFYQDLLAAEATRPTQVTDMTHAIVGIKQPTCTTITLHADGTAQARAEPRDTYGPDNLYGDATVPLTGAVRSGTRLDTPLIRRIADKHGNLQRNKAALDEIEGILTGQDIIVRALTGFELSVTTPEILLTGEPLTVDITLPERHGIKVTLRHETGHPLQVQTPRPSHGHARTTFDDLPPGAYTLDVTGIAASSPLTPVSSDLIVWDPT